MQKNIITTKRICVLCSEDIIQNTWYEDKESGEWIIHESCYHSFVMKEKQEEP